MTNKEKSIAFSIGEFDKIYDFIADDAIWTVIEEDAFIGKKAIVDNCEQVSNYFKSITTKFETLHVIEDAKKVVVSGTAEFLSDGKRTAFVSACDIYEFNEKNEIQLLTSYCIEQKQSDQIFS